MSETTPEQHLPKWEALDRHVRQRIEQTSAVLEVADEVVTAHEVADLNKSLKSEDLLGIPMRVETGLPTFLEKVLTEEGVT